jgi:hypothetical protein
LHDSLHVYYAQPCYFGEKIHYYRKHTETGGAKRAYIKQIVYHGMCVDPKPKMNCPKIHVSL